MMTPQILTAHGLSQDELRALFTADKKSKGVQKFINLCKDRIRDGLDVCVRDHRIYYALDQAYDAPFNQVTHTLVSWLVGNKHKIKSDDVYRIVSDWGLEHMVSDVPCSTCGATCNCGNPKTKKLDLPVFTNIFIPLCKAYGTIRCARIFNDRNLYPLFKYEPVRMTADNIAKCDIVTDRIQLMATQYNYKAALRQMIFQTMHYGQCLVFPQEEWHYEEQVVSMEGKKPKSKVVREGLRLTMPHPGRSFIDPSHRPSTINSDTGCSWAGYWSIGKYGDLKDNPLYWNRDQIAFGNSTWYSSNRTFFSTIYPCSLQFPDFVAARGRVGAGKRDRENTAGFYSTNDADKAVITTNLLIKVVPKDYGMGKYANPVWFRVVMASDDTIIYLRPLCFRPVTWFGYDADENRSLNASLTLETLPFQDHLSNLMTQQLMQVKSNLASLTFVNTDMVEQNVVGQLENMGEQLYRRPIFVPFSGRDSRVAQEDRREAFFPVKFPQMPTAEIQSAMRSLIDLLERILVMSSQEVAQAASHEQTAEESRIIQGSTSTRLEYTSGFVDDGIYALKDTLYQAMMAYADDEIFAQVAIQPPVTKEAVEKLGFKVEDTEGGDTHMGVSGSKAHLELEYFASPRDANQRVQGGQVAANMVQLFQAFISIPGVGAAVGTEEIIKTFNDIARVAGMPKDFRLMARNPEGAPMGVEELQGQLTKMGQQIAQQLTAQQQQAASQLGQQIGAVQQQLSQGLQQVAAKALDTEQHTQANSAQIVQLTEAIKQLIAPPAAPVAPPEQPPRAGLPVLPPAPQ